MSGRGRVVGSSAMQLHVVTCLTNPVRYQSRYRLYRDFAKHIEDRGVPLYTVECAFGDRPFEITDAGNPRHLQLRSAQRNVAQGEPAQSDDRPLAKRLGIRRLDRRRRAFRAARLGFRGGAAASAFRHRAAIFRSARSGAGPSRFRPLSLVRPQLSGGSAAAQGGRLSRRRTAGPRSAHHLLSSSRLCVGNAAKRVRCRRRAARRRGDRRG